MAVSVVNPQPDLTTLQSDIQQLRDDFTKLSNDTRAYAGNGLSSAGAQAQDSAEKMWGEIRRQAQQVGREIEERPLTSAVTAFATGLVLGMILNARRG
jgi:ElaB/YqjD/DUF883 family membrane-anchored ribosome-binding protein